MEVLQQYGQQDDEMSTLLCNTTLETLSEYADWIDISFMVNPVTLSTLCTLMENEQYVENVLLCFEELINKGMPGSNKVRLIHSLGINILYELNELNDIMHGSFINTGYARQTSPEWPIY